MDGESGKLREYEDVAGASAGKSETEGLARHFTTSTSTCFYQVGNWHKGAFQEFEEEVVAYNITQTQRNFIQLNCQLRLGCD